MVCFCKGARSVKLWVEKNYCRHISTSSFSCIRIIFFGTDNFSLGPLNALNEILLNHGVVTQLDVVSSGKTRYLKKKKQLSVPPVISYANTHGLNTISWEKVKKEKRFETEYDLGVVASFGDFIPGQLLSTIPRGAINIHPSLLPRWRGAAPVIHTILAGDTTTGVSVIEVSRKRFDVGKILFQKEYHVPNLCTSDDLLGYLSRKSGELIPFVLNNIEDLQKNAKVQCESLATHAPKVKKCTGYVDFSKHMVSYVRRLQRALPPKIGIRACWDGKEVKFGSILSTMENTQFNHIPMGSCWYEKSTQLVWIQLIDGCISINALTFEKKSEISGVGFHNGYTHHIIDKQTGLIGGTKFESISNTE